MGNKFYGRHSERSEESPHETLRPAQGDKSFLGRLLICTLLFCLLLVPPLPLLAQELKLDVKEHVLKNGLKVLTLERHKSPTVSL
ncbi:MAG TPA: hypothetical protein ACFYED_10160, partial [Candidatus Tripitaka californicus]